MRIFDLLKRGDSILHRFFLIVFAAMSLLTIGCSGDKTQSNSLSKTAPVVSPSASPTSRKPNSADVIAAFEKANLEVVSPRLIEKSEGTGNLNIEQAGEKVKVPEEIEGTEFSIPSAGKNMRGRVFSYKNWEDAAKTRSIHTFLATTYVEGGSDVFNDSLYWNFNYRNLMVQISRKVPQKKAELYFDALLNVN